ncbi:MAG: SDR family NAD(P)-dependent oxidoreductase [Rhodospirillaceae bacterium]
MNGKLTGKRALVTGATRGIGWAIAAALAAEGASVTGTGTRPDGTVPEGCDYLAIDFADTAATEAFAKEARALAPDILINNAGINKIGAFAEIAPEDFRRIQQVNVTAPFILIAAVIDGMKAKGWGRIVNISSIWGKISKEFRASYSSSKFAIDGMTAALSAEVAKHGILANCVAPGFIDTELTRRVLGDDGIAELVSKVPIGRLGTVEEVATFVAWLAGPDNTFISGQNIAIDGGFTRV